MNGKVYFTSTINNPDDAPDIFAVKLSGKSEIVFQAITERGRSFIQDQNLPEAIA